MSRQLPPAEHWRGHLNVPRPQEMPRRGRRFYLVLGASFLAGLLALGGLSLWSELAHRPNVFSDGTGIIFIVCFLFAARFVAPLPLGKGTNAPGPSLYSGQPLPLLTPALAVVAFGLPSLVALVVLIVVELWAR